MSAWAVLVSEVMLQQTPVARVLPAYVRWLARWPTPGHLAAADRGDAVCEWGTLGYPRRALRLHECAVAIVSRHGGEVPSDVETLLALPGVGAYTARAVASFAFGQRHAVVDTNVRRVVSRVVAGVADTAPSATRDLRMVEPLMPADRAAAARFAAAVMELGALVCTARAPRCGSCPIAEECRWRAAGHPVPTALPRRAQAFEGTDRQARGRLLARVRDADAPVSLRSLESAWPEPTQRERALRGLLSDGLLTECADGRISLPS